MYPNEGDFSATVPVSACKQNVFAEEFEFAPFQNIPGTFIAKLNNDISRS